MEKRQAKYKVGDVTIWQNAYGRIQHYVVTEVVDEAYKLKLTYDSDGLEDYHDWSGKEWVENSAYCRLLTPLSKLI